MMDITDRSYFCEMLNVVNCRLNDDQSKALFDIRFKYLIDRNVDEMRDAILTYAERNCQQWVIKELDNLFDKRNIPGIVIFGTGINGKYNLRVLRNSKYKNVKVLFCDNDTNIWGNVVEGVEVISPHDLMINYRDYLCIIGSNRFKNSIFEQLINEDFPMTNILFPRLGVLDGGLGNQYFDYFEATDNEIFLDCGVYDGGTAIEFAKWAKGSYSKVIGVEANPFLIDKCEKCYKNHLDNYEIKNMGLWSGSGKMNFSAWYARASRFVDEGELLVDVDSIDNIMMGNRVSFIKMDIEGAEKEALIGAENVIKKYKPRMALSIYHKPWDFIDIPRLLLEYDSSYKFAIRQYSSTSDETVLYAF